MQRNRSASWTEILDLPLYAIINSPFPIPNGSATVSRHEEYKEYNGGGRGYSRPTFLKYLSGGTQGILNQKFCQLECDSASQIVS